MAYYTHTNATTTTDLPPPESTAKLKGIMSLEAQEMMNLIVFINLQAIVIFPGIVSNVINMCTFMKIGFTDSVTVAFLALSFSDMGCLLIALYNWLCYIFFRIPSDWPIDFFGLMYLGVWYYQAIYDVSMLITVYIAVQKCCCVAMPLKFKTMFTSKRSAKVIAVIWVFCIVNYASILSTQGLKSIKNVSTNKTLLVPRFTKDRELVIAINDVISRVIIQNAAQVIVIACLVILISSLRKQSKFRSKATSSGNANANSGKENDSGKSGKGSASSGISAKELQVIKSVTLVSVIFVLCNFPKIVLSFARTAVPEMDTFRRYHNLHFSLQALRRVIEVFSASINFLIYYKFNNRFREIVVQTFRFADKNKK